MGKLGISIIIASLCIHLVSSSLTDNHPISSIKKSWKSVDYLSDKTGLNIENMMRLPKILHQTKKRHIRPKRKYFHIFLKNGNILVISESYFNNPFLLGK